MSPGARISSALDVVESGLPQTPSENGVLQNRVSGSALISLPHPSFEVCRGRSSLIGSRLIGRVGTADLAAMKMPEQGDFPTKGADSATPCIWDKAVSVTTPDEPRFHRSCGPLKPLCRPEQKGGPAVAEIQVMGVLGRPQRWLGDRAILGGRAIAAFKKAPLNSAQLGRVEPLGFSSAIRKRADSRHKRKERAPQEVLLGHLLPAL